MTDRFHSLTVVLEKDVREDDAEHLIRAIKMMRSVADVRGHVTDHSLHAAEVRVTARWRDFLWKALRDGPPRGDQ